MSGRLYVTAFLLFFAFLEPINATGPKLKTFVGIDSNQDFSFLTPLSNLLDKVPQAEEFNLVDISNVTDVSAALDFGMQVLFMIPGDVPFNTSPEIEGLLSNFVSNGGLLIYTASETNSRAQQVSTWFPAFSELLNVNSTRSSFDYVTLNSMFGPFNPYFTEYFGTASNESLTTSFGRIDSEFSMWGNSFHWFSDSLYWLPNTTYHMQLTPQNEEYCMFRRNGYYYNAVDENACWLFNFPVDEGKIVEIAFTLEDFTGIYYEERKLTGVIQAAFGQLLEEQMFDFKDRSIIVRYAENESYFQKLAHRNVLYDLSLISNVYINRYPPDFATIQYLTNADAYVITPWGGSEYYNIKKRESGNFFYDLRDFVLDGGNIVSAGDINDINLIFSLFYPYIGNQYVIPGAFIPPFGYGLPFNQSEWISSYPAFSLIDELPYRRNFRYFYTYNDNYCLFKDSEYNRCTLWSAEIGSNAGHLSVLGWGFYRGDTTDSFYNPYNSWTFDSWPNVQWRQALHAATNPSGPPVEEIPLLDPNLLNVVSPLNVTLYANYGNYFPRESSVIVSRFLNTSGHNVFLWRDISDSVELNSLLLYSDALVIPNLYYSIAAKAPLPASIENLIRDFTLNGGKTVFTGFNGNRYVNDIFSNTYVFSSYNYYLTTPYNFIPGYLIQSQYTPDTIFTPFYNPGEFLIPFQGRLFTDTLDYCPYSSGTYYGDGDYYGYCGVWSKHYGSGDISILANPFYFNNQGGFKNSYVNSSPWGRILNIAMGGDPNDPTRTATMTPSPSITPSVTQTPTGTPTGTPSPSKTGTNNPSLTPTGTPTQTSSDTPVPSPESTGSPSTSLTPEPSVSITTSSTNTPTETSTPTITPKPSLVIVPPESSTPSKSVGGVVFSASASPSKPNSQVQSLSPSPTINPTSAIINDCNDCSFGSAQVAVDNNNQNNGRSTTEVSLMSDDGNLVGTLFIPDDVNGNGESSFIDVTFATNIPQGNVDLGNSIIDIKITDSFGNQVTQLSSSIEICISNTDNADDGCLSFFNTDTGQWECEDECLKKEGDEYCGTTDHLTSFALLLSGGANGGGGDPCDSDDTDYVLAWISLGFVAFALCCIVLIVILGEIRVQKKQYVSRQNFRSFEDKVSKHM